MSPTAKRSPRPGRRPLPSWDDQDDAISLFGSEEEEDEEAALVAKSSTLLGR